mmetsp:Transcript_744/g.1740  ORF Transcript_744/g.1740 Transcript_744/m.1740 type:complete len:252 (-) Transcript_744:79-834(-)
MRRRGRGYSVTLADPARPTREGTRWWSDRRPPRRLLLPRIAPRRNTRASRPSRRGATPARPTLLSKTGWRAGRSSPPARPTRRLGRTTKRSWAVVATAAATEAGSGRWCATRSRRRTIRTSGGGTTCGRGWCRGTTTGAVTAVTAATPSSSRDTAAEITATRTTTPSSRATVVGTGDTPRTTARTTTVSSSRAAAAATTTSIPTTADISSTRRTRATTRRGGGGGARAPRRRRTFPRWADRREKDRTGQRG